MHNNKRGVLQLALRSKSMTTTATTEEETGRNDKRQESTLSTPFKLSVRGYDSLCVP